MRARLPVAAVSLLAGWTLAGFTPAVMAQPPPPSARVTHPFYRELGQPGAHRAQRLLLQARWQRQAADEHSVGDWSTACRHALAVASPVDHDESRAGSMRALRHLATRALVRRARIDNALSRLWRARELLPNDPDVLFHLAEALAQWEEPGPLWQCGARRRSTDAIRVYEELGRVAPTYRPALVATELAILHTRERQFGAAADAYLRAIDLSLGPQRSTMIRNNLAEVTMLEGDLEGALVHYEHALWAATDGRDRALSLWGLTIALDRLGEHDAALARAHEALQVEGGHMRTLRAPGVFFEPAHEIHYYEALGYEALSQADPEELLERLGQAATSWRAYLAEAPADDPYRANAETNLTRIEEWLTRASRQP